MQDKTGCKGKTRFKTMADADRYAKLTFDRYKSIQHSYFCPVCGNWHLGHSDLDRDNEYRLKNGQKPIVIAKPKPVYATDNRTLTRRA